MTPNPPTEAVKPPLAVIHATHASLGGMKDSGVLGRHARTLRAYKERFDVTVFSADTVGYSDEIGVRHRPVPWMPRTAGFRHAAYYAWLVLNARRMQGAIRVFGSNIPTLPLVKALSGARLVVSHQFDYAALAAQTHGPGSMRASVAGVAEWLGLCAADLVPVTTPVLAAEVKRKYRRPTVLLPNWVDVSDVPLPSAGRTPGAVLYAGRLHRIKGVDSLCGMSVCQLVAA